MNTDRRLYLNGIESIDLPAEHFDAIYHAGHVIPGENGKSCLTRPLSILVFEARCLLSESNENSEYDRALVELVGGFAGLTDDEARALVLSEAAAH